MSKTMTYVFKGLIVVCALLASLMLICPIVASTASATGVSKTQTINLFDCWDAGLKDAPADFAIMTICYSVVFFLGIIIAVLALLSIFVDNKILNTIIKVLAIALAVLAIVGLICNFVYAGSDDLNASIMGAKLASAIGAGSILFTIFSVATAGLVMAEKSLK